MTIFFFTNYFVLRILKFKVFNVNRIRILKFKVFNVNRSGTMDFVEYMQARNAVSTPSMTS